MRGRSWGRTGRRSIAAIAVVLLLSGVGVGVTALSASATQSVDCPDPGDIPEIGSDGPLFTDGNVAVYTGGDFATGENAAEVEGLLVSMGDATFDRASTGSVNVGTVGAGSQITPAPGSEMLIAGGDLHVGSRTQLIVGANAFDTSGVLVGGNIDLGGSADVAFGGAIDTNNGGITERNPDATSDYTGFGASLTSTSANLAAKEDTGSVTEASQVLQLVGDGSSAMQVFTVTTEQLTAATEYDFTGIPTASEGGWVPVVINVLGDGAATMHKNFVSIDGTRVDDPNSSSFGEAASALLWNVTDADDLTVGGTGQNMGSVIVPAEDAKVHITASTNGRFFTNGDITLAGDGNEMHNYPWNGGSGFGCEAPPAEDPTGSVTVAKTLVPGSPLDSRTSAGVRFHGTVFCTLDNGATYTERFTLHAGTTLTLEGLPLRVPCTVSEQLGDTDRATAADAYGAVDMGGFAWAEPVITVNGEHTNAFTVTEASPSVAISIGIVNTVLARFTVAKTVTGPDHAFTDTSRTFDIRYACSADGYTIDDATGEGVAAEGSASGTIALAAGETAGPSVGGKAVSFPTGTTCTVRESTPTGDDFVSDEYSWEAPSISPATITIGGTDAADAVRVISVTNRYAATDEPGSDQPGTDEPGADGGNDQPGDSPGGSGVIIVPKADGASTGADVGTGGAAVASRGVPDFTAMLVSGGLMVAGLTGAVVAAALAARRRRL